MHLELYIYSEDVLQGGAPGALRRAVKAGEGPDKRPPNDCLMNVIVFQSNTARLS